MYYLCNKINKYISVFISFVETIIFFKSILILQGLLNRRNQMLISIFLNIKIYIYNLIFETINKATADTKIYNNA